MSSYKLVTYQSEKGPRAGVVVDDKLFDAAALTRKAAYATMMDIYSTTGRLGEGRAEEGRGCRWQKQAEEPPEPRRRSFSRRCFGPASILPCSARTTATT